MTKAIKEEWLAKLALLKDTPYARHFICCGMGDQRLYLSSLGVLCELFIRKTGRGVWWCDEYAYDDSFGVKPYGLIIDSKPEQHRVVPGPVSSWCRSSKDHLAAIRRLEASGYPLHAIIATISQL